jgi:hypothetical protein
MRKRVYTVEARGFYDGSQGIDPAPSKAELAARFQQMIEEARKESVVRSKAIEGNLLVLADRKTDAEARWLEQKSRTGYALPQVALPIIALLAAALAIAGEMFLLAPVMDGFGIADPAWQHITALVIVITSSGLFELTLRQNWHSSPSRDGIPHSGEGATSLFSRIRRGGLVVLLTITSFTLLVVMGWWRAEEMVFGAGAQGGDLGNFLAANGLLTRVCVTLLSAGLPVFAAVVLDWALTTLRRGMEWRSARRDILSYPAQLGQAEKQLESEKERCERQIAVTEKQRDEWISMYEQGYAVGRAVGARKIPSWQVALKIAAALAVTLVLCVVVELCVPEQSTRAGLRVLAYALVTSAVVTIYSYRVLKVWDRPEIQELFEHRVVVWRSEERMDAGMDVKPIVTPALAEPLKVMTATAGNGNGHRTFK